MSEPEIVEILIVDSLKHGAEKYGIEGLEDKIKEIYAQMPYARELILNVYHKLYKGQR